MSREPVRRSHFFADVSPDEVYAVVVDFPAYPRLFSELRSARVLETEGRRLRVEFVAQVVLPARYVLDLVCEPEARTVDWTFVEGEVVSDSFGSWRFFPERGGTRVEYAAALDVRAPLPGFVVRKILDALQTASLPAMFASLGRELASRRQTGAPARP